MRSIIQVKLLAEQPVPPIPLLLSGAEGYEFPVGSFASDRCAGWSLK
jgi:hypothetical protein